ncbi:MAG: hypothetical protein JO265_07980 [Acidimicrobiia bacterium]|nr:hypothetical protein [Acidimicrobiia bacterium]
MDRDLAEHMAKDTGLRPEDISPAVEPAAGDEVAEHLAGDTGLEATELADDRADPVDRMVGRLPVD